MKFVCKSSSGEITIEPQGYNDVDPTASALCTPGYVNFLKMINDFNYNQLHLLSNITMSNNLSTASPGGYVNYQNTSPIILARVKRSHDKLFKNFATEIDNEIAAIAENLVTFILAQYSHLINKISVTKTLNRDIHDLIDLHYNNTEQLTEKIGQLLIKYNGIEIIERPLATTFNNLEKISFLLKSLECKLNLERKEEIEKITSNNVKIDELNKNLENKQNQINELDANLKNLQKKINNLIRENELQIANAKSTITNLQNNIIGLNKKVKIYEEDKNKIEKLKEIIEAKLKIANDTANWEHEIEMLKIKIKEKEKKIDELNIKLEDNKVLLNNFIDLNTKYINKVFDLEEVIGKLENDIKEHANTKALSEEGKKLYEKLISENKKGIEENNEKINKIKNENNQLEQEKEMINSEIKKLLLKQTEFEKAFDKNKNEIDNLKSKYQLMDKDTEDLANQILELELFKKKSEQLQIDNKNLITQSTEDFKVCNQTLMNFDYAGYADYIYNIVMNPR